MLKAPLMHPNGVITESPSCTPQLLLTHCWSATPSTIPPLVDTGTKSLQCLAMALCPASKNITEKNSAPSPCPQNSAPLAHEIQQLPQDLCFPCAFNLSYSPPIPSFANLLHMFQPHLSLFSLIQCF